MSKVSTILKQILDFLPYHDLNRFVGQHQTDRYTKSFSTKQQLITMLYAQASGKNSLRDIELGLRSQNHKWYHLGLKSVSKSTIARTNNLRTYLIFEKLFYSLLSGCKQLTSATRKFNFTNPLYSIDASLIQLSLQIFPWSYYQKTKGAIKLHTLLNNRTLIPEFLHITHGNKPEMIIAREANLNIPKYSILVMDKGYVDLNWFYQLNKKNNYFVTRMKRHILYQTLEVMSNYETGVLKDEIIKFTGRWGSKNYPLPLRMVTFYDQKNEKIYQFITNNLVLSAKTIADIYSYRWQIEIFFKWIKQNLKIKTFLGTSKNAVLTQIWIAMIYYLIIAFIVNKTRITTSLRQLSQIFKELLLERMPLISILGINYRHIYICKNRASPQLTLF